MGTDPELGGQFSGMKGDRPRTWGDSSQESMVTDPELGGTVLRNQGGQTPNLGDSSQGRTGTDLGVGGQFSGVNGDRPRTQSGAWIKNTFFVAAA